MIKKSRQEIEIDFMRAMNQAQELDEIASSMVQLAGEHVDNTMAILKSSFKGDNGAAFCKKGEGLRLELLDAADDLVKVAKSIRQTADIVYRAEKASVGIFG